MTGFRTTFRTVGIAISSLAGKAVSVLTLEVTGGQIAFPSTAAPSADPNTLDDYEEGTWTPEITFTTPGDLSVAYSAQAGFYTKVGNLVTLQYVVVTSTFTHSTASGQLRITGVPFTSASLGGRNWAGALEWQGIDKTGYTYLAGGVLSSDTEINFIACAMGANRSSVSASDVPSGGTVQLNGTLMYRV